MIVNTLERRYWSESAQGVREPSGKTFLTDRRSVLLLASDPLPLVIAKERVSL